MSFSILRACPSCGKQNRIPARHLADEGHCGSCKSPLPPQSEPIDVDEAGFSEVVRDAHVPILADFWAPWCGPCRMSASEVKQLARDMAGKALVLKINTDENPALSDRFAIRSIPNFVVLRDGRVAFQRAGLAGRNEMRRWLETTVSV